MVKGILSYNPQLLSALSTFTVPFRTKQSKSEITSQAAFCQAHLDRRTEWREETATWSNGYVFIIVILTQCPRLRLRNISNAAKYEETMKTLTKKHCLFIKRGKFSMIQHVTYRNILLSLPLKYFTWKAVFVQQMNRSN